jgi:DNA-binding IclR family transcriptional regulator
MMLQQAIFSPQTKSSQNDLIGSVQRALCILELLAQYPAGLNAKQVSQKLQLNLSTCYHLLNTLIASGYAIKDPDNLLFRLSGKIGYTVLGSTFPAQLVQQLTPHVQALQEATLETAYLSLWDGEEIILSGIVESPRSVRVKSLTIGYSEANHATALGKAILAYFDETQLDHYLSGRELPAYTPNTLTNPTALKTYLPKVRQQGFSLDIEEFLPDVCCIGAPIFDAWGGVAASIAISLPTIRYHAHWETLLPKVAQAAKAATRSLKLRGYARPSAAPPKAMI